ncbi:MAG: KamA family radical SAM protein [bacterium]
MYDSYRKDTYLSITSLPHKYKSYSLHNYKALSQIHKLSKEQLFEIDAVARVFPFKTNNYVINELIDWHDVPNDPIFKLTFPHRGMLKPHHFDEIVAVMKEHKNEQEIRETANRIRLHLNPHPDGQMEHNVPKFNGRRLSGIQHKYEQTVLFFPSQGQTCHAYCSYCFRWPQFVGMDELKFAMREAGLLVAYLREHKEVSDVLFTGGDPLVMKARVLASYLEPLLNANLSSLQTIRIGTKSLSFWPYKFLVGNEAEEILALFRRIVHSGKHLAFMAHFSHPRELTTRAVRQAIRKIRKTGAEIRTQSPVLRHINDSPQVWADMWQKQVKLGCIPYYMFVVRDTGAQHYFGVSLAETHRIFKRAYQQVSGLGRTVRGPSMSADPGKIQILGVDEICGEKVFVLNMLQARKPELVMQPFYAKFDEEAMWIDDLKPALGERRFIFE